MSSQRLYVSVRAILQTSEGFESSSSHSTFINIDTFIAQNLQYLGFLALKLFLWISGDVHAFNSSSW